jgi:hypothetical protein
MVASILRQEYRSVAQTHSAGGRAENNQVALIACASMLILMSLPTSTPPVSSA